MKAVRVLAPAGSALEVFEVAVESDGQILSFLRTSGGGEPRAVAGRYASLQEAFARNNRTITTAETFEVANLQEARAMVEASA